MGIFDQMKAAGMRQVLAYIEKDPDTNILKIIDWMIKFNVAGSAHNADLLNVRAYLSDQNSSWYRLVRSLWTDIDDGIRKTFFENLVINAGLARQNSKEKSEEDLPMGIMLDQTGNVELNRLPAPVPLSLNEYDQMIRKNKRKGVFAFIFTGGADSITAADLRKLARVHSDCIFVTMMKPEEVDSYFADMCFAAQNIAPMIAYENCDEACMMFKARKLGFGTFCYCSRENHEELASGDFVRKMINNGAKLVWIFSSEGENAADQAESEAVYGRVLSARNTEPVLIVDFLHEEKFLGGRISGI